MKFFKKHKVGIIIIGSFLILCIAAFIFVYINFLKENKGVYGNRLDGIAEVVITDTMVSELKSKILESKFVNTCEYSLQGKLIKLIIDVKDTDLKTAKTIGSAILDYFEDKYKEYYDIEIFLTNKTLVIDEDSDIVSEFPKIGYKHRENSDFAW